MKLPPQAKCVFKGEIFDVYHWPQKMFDGSVETFEMLKRPDTVQIICTQGDKIIIAEESQPTHDNFFTLFGGRKEENEDHLAAAKRELKEEAGLESDEWEEIKVYKPYIKMEWEIHLFVARNCKKTSEQKLDPGEKIKPVELTFAKFIDATIGKLFWEKEFAIDVMHLKLDGKLNELKKQIFGK